MIYLHGLGGTPGDGLARTVYEAMQEQNPSVEFLMPWLRPSETVGADDVRPVGPHTMTTQLELAAEAIQAAPGPVVILGHSFGGKAAFALARRFPGKVRGVVALAPSVRMLYAHWKRITEERGLSSPDVMRARLQQHEADLNTQISALVGRRSGDRTRDRELNNQIQDLREWVEFNDTMIDMVDHDEDALETNVPAPTLVFHGTDDRAVSIHYARRFAEANPRAQLVELDGVTHGFRYRPRDEHLSDRERTRQEANNARDIATRTLRFIEENSR